MTHYDEFGLSPTASPEEIQRAHRNLVRLLHPDPIQDEALRRLAEGQLKRLNSIYSVLIDPARRRKYDFQLIRPASPPEMLALAGRRRRPWFAPAAVGILSLAAGFQSAVWWNEPGSGSAGNVIYVERPNRPASPPALPNAAPVTREDNAPLLADTRELRRMLNQVITERDQALARLNSLGTAPVLSASAALAADEAPHEAGRPTTPTAALQRGRVAVGVREPEASLHQELASPPQAERPTLTGTWIYSAPVRHSSPSDQYPAEYIELLLTERGSFVGGRYRARYKVPDRAISPEVQFYFEGPADIAAVTAGARYQWRGDGASAGEIRLKLLSENTLTLDWFTTQLGRSPMLGSGSAVLVRRRQD